MLNLAGCNDDLMLDSVICLTTVHEICLTGVFAKSPLMPEKGYS